MKRRLLASVLAVVLVLVIATGTAWSMSSLNFNLKFDSLMGGGSGGGVSTSAGYYIEGTFEGAIYMYDASSGYKLCSGFVCFVNYFDRFLPISVK